MNFFEFKVTILPLAVRTHRAFLCSIGRIDALDTDRVIGVEALLRVYVHLWDLVLSTVTLYHGHWLGRGDWGDGSYEPLAWLVPRLETDLGQALGDTYCGDIAAWLEWVDDGGW